MNKNKHFSFNTNNCKDEKANRARKIHSSARFYDCLRIQGKCEFG